MSNPATLSAQVKVVTAIQCAGNRRGDMTNVKPVKGLGWSCGAISNCEWTGVLLRDVLKDAGVDVEDPESAGIEHVQFEGEYEGRELEVSWCATLCPSRPSSTVKEIA